MIRRGIDSSYISRSPTNREPELVAKTISAHEDVLEGLFDFVAQRRELSSSYIKELHAALLRIKMSSRVSTSLGLRFMQS